jgi:uncharacterized protein (TIGR03083 family)
MATPISCVPLSQSVAEGLAQYLQTLPATAWHHPSRCEGWEVRDVVGHLVWVATLYADVIARGLQGNTAPLDGFPPAGALDQAARSAFIAQRAIAQRASLGEQLLATFTARTAQLHQRLLTLSLQEWDLPCYHPARLFPVQAFVPLWLTELVFHSWDIRAALDPAASLAAESFPMLMERIPQRVNGTFRPQGRLAVPVRYRFILTEVVPDTHDIVVEGDTVRMEPAGTVEAMVTFRCDAETFLLLMYGRLTQATATDQGRLVSEGDRQLVAAFEQWFKGS